MATKYRSLKLTNTIRGCQRWRNTNLAAGLDVVRIWKRHRSWSQRRPRLIHSFKTPVTAASRLFSDSACNEGDAGSIVLATMSKVSPLVSRLPGSSRIWSAFIWLKNNGTFVMRLSADAPRLLLTSSAAEHRFRCRNNPLPFFRHSFTILSPSIQGIEVT